MSAGVTTVESLQAVLAAEHATIYGYGIVGAHLSGPAQQQAAQDWDAHRARRDQLQEMLRARGVMPVAAAPAYRLPFPVTDPRAAVRLAAYLEDRLATAYLQLVAVSEPQARRFGAVGLQEVAVRATRWRGSAQPFPGMPPAAVS